jgi:hypothetical protein
VQCDFWVSLTLWTKSSFGADNAKKIGWGEYFVATSLTNWRNEEWTPINLDRLPAVEVCKFCNSYQTGVDRLASLTKESTSNPCRPTRHQPRATHRQGVLSNPASPIMNVPPLLRRD